MTLEQRMHLLLADELISTNEIILAATAWKNFLSKGRGFLYVYRNLNPGLVILKTGKYHHSPNYNERIFYVAKDTEEYNYSLEDDIESESEEFIEEFYGSIDGYEPENDFITLVSMPSSVKSCIEIWSIETPEIPPYKAFHMVKENPSDFGIIDFEYEHEFE